VALVKLSDFFAFMTTDEGVLIDHLFESNVRDYQRDVEVNRAIRDSLKQADGKEDFWWLNNGITIVATQAGGARKDLVMHNPQVVNGLQRHKKSTSILPPTRTR